jgi:hypothetical protein
VSFVQEKPKGRWRMDASMDCEAPDTFYRVEEGGETVSWRRNGQCRVELFNASVSGRREEETTCFRSGKDHTGRLLVPERRGDRRMQQHGGVRRQPTAGVRRRLE